MVIINEQKKQAYRQKIEAQIMELKAKKQMLQANAKESEADMRVEYQKRLDDLQDQFTKLEGQLKQLSNTAEDSWDEIQAGIDKSMVDLRNSIENAAKKIKV